MKPAAKRGGRKPVVTWYVHRFGTSTDARFFLGCVSASTAQVALRVAAKTWPHWRKDMQVEEAGPVKGARRVADAMGGGR